MSTTTPTRDWFRTATEPPCVEWCAGEHRGDDWTRNGGVMCAKRVDSGSSVDGTWSVEVTAHTLADEENPGRVIYLPAAVWFLVDSEDLAPDAADAFAATLVRAAAIARATTRP